MLDTQEQDSSLATICVYIKEYKLLLNQELRIKIIPLIFRPGAEKGTAMVGARQP